MYDGIDLPIWTYDAVQRVTLYYEQDTLGNVRRLRGGRTLDTTKPAPASDLGGYRYSAFGRLKAADTGTPAPLLRGVAYDQPIRWQGRWFSEAGGGTYDFRARVWSPTLGEFAQADEFGFLTRTGTLWSWPGQNPFAWRDPRGRGLPAVRLPSGGVRGVFPGLAGGAANDTAVGVGVGGGGGSFLLGGGLIAIGLAEIGYAAYEIVTTLDEFEHPTVTYGSVTTKKTPCPRTASAGGGSRQPPGASSGGGRGSGGPTGRGGGPGGPRNPLHHIYPQEFKAEFEAMGIDIDQFTFELPPDVHADVHTAGWNADWAEFLYSGSTLPTAAEAQRFAADMIFEYGLEGYAPFVPYR